jgi:hypothetical protein
MFTTIVSRVNSFVGSLKKELNDIVSSPPVVPLISSIGYPHTHVVKPPTPPLASEPNFDSVIALKTGDDFCDVSGNGYVYRHAFGVWQICTKDGLVHDLTLDVSGNAYWTDLSGCAHFVPNPFGRNSSYFAGATVQPEKHADYCDISTGRYYTQGPGGWQVRFADGSVYPLVLDTSGGAVWVDVSGGSHWVPSPFGAGSGLFTGGAEGRSQCTAACDCLGGACVKSCSMSNLRLLDVEDASGMDCDKTACPCPCPCPSDASGGSAKIVCDGGVCYISKESKVAVNSFVVAKEALCKDGIDCECTGSEQNNMIVD